MATWKSLVEELGGTPPDDPMDLGTPDAVDLARELARSLRWTNPSAADVPSGTVARRLREAAPALRAEVVAILLAIGVSLPPPDPLRFTLRALAQAALDDTLPLDEAGLVAVLRSELDHGTVLAAVAARHPGPPAVAAALARRVAAFEATIGWEAGGELRGLRLLAARLSAADGMPLAPCPWGDQVAGAVRAEPDRDAWIAVLWHAVELGTRTRPTRAWSAEGARRVDAIGAERLRDRVTAWLDLVPAPEVVPFDPTTTPGAARPTNLEVARGLLFLVAPHADGPFVDALTEVALRAWEEGVFGPRAPHFGVGVIAALGACAPARVRPAAARLRSAVSYARAVRELDRLG